MASKAADEILSELGNLAVHLSTTESPVGLQWTTRCPIHMVMLREY